MQAKAAVGAHPGLLPAMLAVVGAGAPAAAAQPRGRRAALLRGRTVGLVAALVEGNERNAAIAAKVRAPRRAGTDQAAA